MISRRFGGSTADDFDNYLQRIVFVYKPRAVVIYQGENDLGNGQTSSYVANRIAGILAIQRHIQCTRYVISIKTTPTNIQSASVRSANQLLVALCASDARYTYIDTASSC